MRAALNLLSHARPLTTGTSLRYPSYFPYAPTLEGQYIIKNIVLISAALVVGATVRGGRIVADPAVIGGR